MLNINVSTYMQDVKQTVSTKQETYIYIWIFSTGVCYRQSPPTLTHAARSDNILFKIKRIFPLPRKALVDYITKDWRPVSQG